MTELANPFDDFADPEDVPASQGLQAGPAPSFWDTISTNFSEPFRSGILGSLRSFADKKTIDRSERQGTAQPGDSPLDGKVSQAEADQARQRLSQRKRERENYEAFDSQTIPAKAAGLLSGLAGGLLQPENVATAGGVVARGIASGARAVGLTGALSRMVGAGAEAAAVNAALDVPTQALQIGAGIEQHYSLAQTAAAFGLGGVLGGGMQGVAEIVGRGVKAKEGVPPADITVRPSPEAVAPDPAVVAAREEAAFVAATIPDAELNKFAEAAALVPRTGEANERVRVPLSTEEAASLKQLGIDVDERGTIPASLIDIAIQERVRRDAVSEAQAVEVQAKGRAPEEGAGGDRANHQANSLQELGEVRVSALRATADTRAADAELVQQAAERGIYNFQIVRQNGEIAAVRTADATLRVVRDEDGTFAGLSREPAQPMAAYPGGAAPTTINPDARFPARRELAGEASKPGTATTPEGFRVTDAMRGIAERLGRKIEVDRRFSTKGSLGEYKPKEGVIRIRQEGDYEVFSHEVGHAVDQRLKSPEWDAVRQTHAAELKALDANTTDPAKQTVNEGVAEFLRSYVTNPAYARKQAPNVADAFERLVETRDPELASILADASRISQIDSGMAPTAVFETMVVPGDKLRGFAKFRQEAQREGFTPTLGLWFDRFYAATVGTDHWGKRVVDNLLEARFEKTGTPAKAYGWTNPQQLLRGLPGAKQAAIDAIYGGVRGYGRAFDPPESPALYDALSKAFGGHVSASSDQSHPLVQAFSGYLVARRSYALYQRWKAGELKSPPVRASENETLAAIANFELENPTFREAADEVFAFSNAMWRKKFEAGLISREIYDTVAGRGDDYVPFYRDMRDDKGNGRGVSGAGQERSVVKGIKGSTRDIINPIHSLVFDAMQTERIIALNDVFKAMHKLAQSGGEFAGRFLERVPNTEIRAQSLDLAEGVRAAAKRQGLDQADAEVAIRHLEELIGDDLSATVFRATQTTAKGERIAFYWDAGERVALKFGQDEHSKNFFDTISAMSIQERDLMLALMGKTNALFSQLITNAPQFAIKNLLMDNITRIFMARNTGWVGRVPGAALAQGVYTQVFDREFTRAYGAVGGIRGGVMSAAARELDEARGLRAITMKPKTLADLQAEATALLRSPKDLTIAVATSPYKALELIVKGIEATETMGRLGQAKIVFKHLKKQGLNDEEAFRAAVYEARDVLDYDRKGWGVKGATKFFVFMNPNIQGLERSARTLFGGPLEAALQSYRRGGYQNLDEAAKTALSDAVANWGMIAAGVVGTMGYYAWNADDPVYQRMTDYMKRRYFIFNAGVDKDGKQNVVTVPKPFDHAGAAFAAVEAAMDGIRRADPEGWHRVVKALADGFIPRQLQGLQEFIGGNPFLKTGFEVSTGQKLGFEGSSSQPIVPADLRARPPEQQYNGYTSYLAKKLGDWFAISPMVADHVMNGLGGTAARDTSHLATAIFDDQPNVTVKDAMTRMFFGALYREQRGGGSFRSDLMELMGRENGKYVIAANGYARSIEEGDSEAATSIYARGNDLAKTIMTIRSGSFKPPERQLHPLERSSTLGEIFSKVTRDLAGSQVEIIDRARKRGQERDYIDLPSTTARALSATIGSLMAEEMRNGLSIAKQPGYEAFATIDTKPRYDAIRALSPEVADEIEKRMKKAHIQPFSTIQRAWPHLKERLLKDREQAKLTDLKGRLQ